MGTIVNAPSDVKEVFAGQKKRKRVSLIAANPLIFMAHPPGLEPGKCFFVIDDAGYTLPSGKKQDLGPDSP